MTDAWAPLGRAGSVPVVDALSLTDLAHLPERTPLAERCTIDVAGHLVNVTWRHRLLVASIVGDDASSVVAESDPKVSGEGEGSIVWQYRLMPLRILGEPIAVERRRSGRDRWSLRVQGPEGRAWEWRPAGRIFADRMELTRDGDREPTVTHLLRPAPGHPRSPEGPPTVSWEESASLAEVLMPVMWVLDHAYAGLLPKAQRVARMDFL